MLNLLNGATSKKQRRENYDNDNKQWAEIAWHTAENGHTNTGQHFSDVLNKISESPVN